MMARGKMDSSSILAAVVKYHQILLASIVCGLYLYGLFFDAHPLFGQIALLLVADIYLAKVSPLLGFAFVLYVWFFLEFMYNFAFRLFVACVSAYATIVKFAHPLFYRVLPWLCAHPFCYLAYGPWSIIGLLVVFLPYAFLWRLWDNEIVKVLGSPLYPLIGPFPSRPSPWQKARPVLYRLVSEALSNLDWVGPFRGGNSECSLSLRDAAWAAAPYMVIGGRLAACFIAEPGPRIWSSLEALAGWWNRKKFDYEARESWKWFEWERVQREAREALEQEQREKEARKRAADEASRRCREATRREARRIDELRKLRAAEERERRSWQMFPPPIAPSRKSVQTR